MNPPAPVTTTRSLAFSLLISSLWSQDTGGDCESALTDIQEIGDGPDGLGWEHPPTIDDWKTRPGSRERIRGDRRELGPRCHDDEDIGCPDALFGARRALHTPAELGVRGAECLGIKADDRVPFIQQPFGQCDALALFDDGGVRLVRQAENADRAFALEARLHGAEDALYLV